MKMASASATDTGATKMEMEKMRPRSARITKCPATMLAKRRTVRAKGLVKSPRNSTGIMMGHSQASDLGTPPVMWARYPLMPIDLMAAYWVTKNVNSASATVTEMLAVAVAMKGTSPSRFMVRTKKKAVHR